MKSIYILLTKSDTILSRIVHLVTNDTYTHASISFDESMRTLYSSSRKNGRTLFPAGPCRENLRGGYYKRHKWIPCAVYELQVSDEVYEKAKWTALISGYLAAAKVFEIHCWNEEAEWIDLALQYGRLKDDDWRYGKIITGAVTPQFAEMLLGQPKPTDTELYQKMTPFFSIFLDDSFQSCHYGTENYHK